MRTTSNEPGAGDRNDDSVARRTTATVPHEFFFRYRGYVFGFFRGRGFPEPDTEELSQEVFLRVFENLGQLRSVDAEKAWLRTVMATVWKNELRRRQAIKRDAKEVSFEAEQEAGNAAVERHPMVGGLRPPDPLEEALGVEHLAAVRACLSELSPPSRHCLLLFAVQERSYREIASLLRLSVEQVKSQIYQARQRLQACIDRKAQAGSARLG